MKNYIPTEKNRKRSIFYFNLLNDQNSEFRKKIDQIETKSVPELSLENEEHLLNYYDNFLKLYVILQDYPSHYDWQNELIEKINKLKIKYRLSIIEKYQPEERISKNSELKQREVVALTSHQFGLCEISSIYEF